MSEAKHTKGPWRAIYRGFDQDANWVSRIPYAIERVVGGAVAPIADVCDQPQAEANAALLAAAPELLALLIESQDSIGGDWRERRDAAVAKATGGAK